METGRIPNFNNIREYRKARKEMNKMDSFLIQRLEVIKKDIKETKSILGLYSLFKGKILFGDGHRSITAKINQKRYNNIGFNDKKINEIINFHKIKRNLDYENRKYGKLKRLQEREMVDVLLKYESIESINLYDLFPVRVQMKSIPDLVA